MAANKITYLMIARYINQTVSSMKQLKKSNPKKLELYKFGLTYMIENNLIKVEDLKK